MTTTNGHGTQLMPHTTPQPGRIGQATAVEQSRAVAEVQAAVIVAQQCPRDIQEALRQMRDSCNRMALAERAFFRVPRGDKVVSRPSVHLARELARIWGNLDWGTAELRRDDDHKQSEMMAFAWDLQTNSRNRATFIVPHRRDTKQGPRDLSTQQDIYENNANNGARRLREVIFATLPSWFTEEAEQICARRISEGDGTPLEDRVANCVDRYTKIGVTVAQLEAKTGSDRADWTPNDLAQLGVIYQSIMRHEISKEDEFPSGRVTAADITGQPKSETPARASSGQPAGQEPAAGPEPSGGPVDPPAQRATKAQTGELEGLLAKFPWREPGDKAVFLQWRCGAPYRASKGQVIAVTRYLAERLEAAEGDVEEALSAIWGEYQASQGQDASGEPEPGDHG